jgi:hypothetical protein
MKLHVPVFTEQNSTRERTIHTAESRQWLTDKGSSSSLLLETLGDPFPSKGKILEGNRRGWADNI